MTPSRRGAAGALLALSLTLVHADSGAHETDQFTIRDIAIADSTDLLNAEFNRVLGEIADEWLGGPSPRRFAKRVFYTMGGLSHVDKYERWARRSPDIDLLRMDRQESIYRGGPFWETRVVFFYGLGPVMRINGHLVGSDKIGHFLSQGWKYHKRFLETGDERKVIDIGKRNEAGIFGFLTTGVFSNADLVANFEGYRFYRSLFEDDVISGKPALIEWLGVGARLRREFDWRDHVNAYWDEALNPSIYDSLLRKRVRSHLAELCDLYFAMPEEFVMPHDAELVQRYAHLGLRDAADNRLDAVCEVEPAEPTRAATAARH